MILKLFTLSATSGSRSVQFTMQIYASFNALRTTVTCRDSFSVIALGQSGQESWKVPVDPKHTSRLALLKACSWCSVGEATEIQLNGKLTEVTFLLKGVCDVFGKC